MTNSTEITGTETITLKKDSIEERAAHSIFTFAGFETENMIKYYIESEEYVYIWLARCSKIAWGF